jgi:hypothetical protein
MRLDFPVPRSPATTTRTPFLAGTVFVIGAAMQDTERRTKNVKYSKRCSYIEFNGPVKH